MTTYPRANPSRLSLARKRRGLTKAALAMKTGFSTRAIYDFESGRAAPSSAALEAIAEVTRFPIRFFFRPDLEELASGMASFRSLRSMTSAQEMAALSAGVLAFELSDWIDRRFELPPVDVPDYPDYESEAAATSVRSYWGIGERPIGNMIHLLESRGVRVFSFAEHTRRVDAFSLWYRNAPFVFLNTNKTAEHSRMDAAHELGHLVMHRRIPHGSNLEKEAQAFGAAFLMPEKSILANTPSLVAPTISQLLPLKRYWRVSIAALVHRLNRLGLVSDWNYRRLCIEISRYGRTREPEGIPREESQVLVKVFETLKDSGLSRSEVARQLDLYQTDVDALIFGLSLSPVLQEGDSVSDEKAAETRKQFKIISD